MMLWMTEPTFWEHVKGVLWWFVEGLIGTLTVATQFHTDVPWYQCLASQLIILIPTILLVLWAQKRKKDKAFRERCERGDA